MNDKLNLTLIIAAILGTGLVAGVFLAFSSFIMEALGRVPPPAGMAVMQQINISVITPLFMIILFGTAIVCMLLGINAFLGGFGWHNILLIVAMAFYVLGVIGVTLVCNVPLNDELATASPIHETGIALWSRYLTNWTFCNTVRGLASSAACAVFALALR